MPKFYFSLFICFFTIRVFSQISSPDTTCLSKQVNFSSPSGATNYSWIPDAFSIHNIDGTDHLTVSAPGGSTWLWNPMAITMNYDNGQYYGFVLDAGGFLIRLDFTNTPATFLANATHLLAYGVGSSVGFDLVKDNSSGQWFGFITNNARLFRVKFGTSLTNNTPTMDTFSFSPTVASLQQMTIKQYGNQWVGFSVDATKDRIVRFDFGTSITNTPVITLLGNSSVVNGAHYFSLHQENNNWYMIVSNMTGQTVSRFNFGSNIQNNAPITTNLGNLGVNFYAPGCTFTISSCDSVYTIVHDQSGYTYMLDFGTSITNTPVATSMGGAFTFASTLGTMTGMCPFWFNDGLYFLLACNGAPSQIKTVHWLDVTPGTTTSSPLYNYTFTSSGNHKMSLVQDMGNASGNGSFCKTVYVSPLPVVAVTAVSTVLTTTGTTGTYKWFLNGNLISGATGTTYTALQTGSYTVEVTDAHGCTAVSSAVAVTVGIEKLMPENWVTIYPNPATSTLNISIAGSNSDAVYLKYYNTVGMLVQENKLMLTNGVTNTPADISALPKGIYFLKLTTQGGYCYVRQITVE